MADLVLVRRRAEALITQCQQQGLLGSGWTFGFDTARTRAGQCNHTRRRITVSRVLASRFEDREVHQVLLHEVAHAIAGHEAGHGPEWQRTAQQLGYMGGRVHIGTRTDDLAPWIGQCPAGHLHYRYRRPDRDLSCAKCARWFDPTHRIAWRRRSVPRTA